MVHVRLFYLFGSNDLWSVICFPDRKLPKLIRLPCHNRKNQFLFFFQFSILNSLLCNNWLFWIWFHVCACLSLKSLIIMIIMYRIAESSLLRFCLVAWIFFHFQSFVSTLRWKNFIEIHNHNSNTIYNLQSRFYRICISPSSFWINLYNYAMSCWWLWNQMKRNEIKLRYSCMNLESINNKRIILGTHQSIQLSLTIWSVVESFRLLKDWSLCIYINIFIIAYQQQPDESGWYS